jgi:hypothetical protein
MPRIILIIISILIIIAGFIYWGLQHRKFNNVEFSRLRFFMNILFYRGYSLADVSTNGKMYIYNKKGNRYVVLEKIKSFEGEEGLYFYIPVYKNYTKEEIKTKIEGIRGVKDIWEDNLHRIENSVIGIDIGKDMTAGEMILNRICFMVFGEEVLNMRYYLRFEGIDIDVTKLNGFDIEKINLEQIDGDLLMPMHNIIRFVELTIWPLRRMFAIFKRSKD